MGEGVTTVCGRSDLSVGRRLELGESTLSTNVLKMRQPSPVGIDLEPWTGGPATLRQRMGMDGAPFLPMNSSTMRRDSGMTAWRSELSEEFWKQSVDFGRVSARAVDRSNNLFYDVGFRVIAILEDGDPPLDTLPMDL